MKIPGFDIEPLENMAAVGLVAPRKVRLWMRTRRPGNVRVSWSQENSSLPEFERILVVPEGSERDNAYAFEVPGEAGPGLLPLTRYRYRISHVSDGELIGEGHFETAPERPADTPDRFSVAVMSCNQPFSKEGRIVISAREMLTALGHCLETHNVKIVFMVGDQMYSDLPEHLSLFNPRYFARVRPSGRTRIQDCTPDEVRRLYHERYRVFWALPEFRFIQAHYPCYMIFDDHDVVDNWGSRLTHLAEEWQSVGMGARLACFDYQSSRILPLSDTLPEDFHFSSSYGHTAFFVFDLRSTRRPGDDGQLFSRKQADEFERFLKLHQHVDVILIVLSVPVVHLPHGLVKIASIVFPGDEDFSDRWSADAHLRDRDWFLTTLYQHQHAFPSQKIVLLSGDIHIGCVHRISWDKHGQAFYQVISSAITHETGRPIQVASKLLIHMNRRIITREKQVHGRVNLVNGSGDVRRNPYGGLNFGIVEIEKASGDKDAKLRFYLYGHKGDKPVCVYRSDVVTWN